MKASRDGKSGKGGSGKPPKPARQPSGYEKVHEVKVPVRNGIPVHRKYRRHRRTGRIKNERTYSREKDILKDPDMWRAQADGPAAAGALNMRRERARIEGELRRKAERSERRRTRRQSRRAAVARTLRGTGGPPPTPEHRPRRPRRWGSRTIGQPDDQGFVNPDNGPLLGGGGWRPWRRR